MHPLDSQKIRSALPQRLAAGLHVFEQVGSTNLWLMEHARKLPDANEISGQSCFTDEQTNGRGRRGRVWNSVAGDDITFSMAWSFASTNLTGALTLATAVTVATTLEAVCGQPLSIKWPNDIYCRDRKLVGILTEAAFVRGTLSSRTIVVVGVGVNLSTGVLSTVDRSVEQPAERPIERIGLLDLVASVDRNQLAAQLLSSLAQGMQKFEQDGLAGFRHAYYERDYLKNRSVTVQQAGQTWTGTALGIAEDGALNIEDDSGARRQVHAADVTIRWRDGSTD